MPSTATNGLGFQGKNTVVVSTSGSSERNFSTSALMERIHDLCGMHRGKTTGSPSSIRTISSNVRAISSLTRMTDHHEIIKAILYGPRIIFSDYRTISPIIKNPSSLSRLTSTTARSSRTYCCLIIEVQANS